MRYSTTCTLRGIALLAAGLCVLSAMNDRAWAVSVSTSTYAKDTSAAAPNPKTLSETKTSATLATSNITSSVTAANAQAWATSQVTSSGVVKSASGRSWVTAGFDVKATSWSSYASGTTIRAHYVGPADVNGDNTVDANDQALLNAGLSVPFKLYIPATFSDPNAPTNGPFAVPAQSLFNDASRITGGAPSFFDVFFQIDATLIPLSGGSPVELFHGTALLNHNSQLQFGGGFSSGSNPFSVSTLGGRMTAAIQSDFQLATVNLLSDKDYDLTFNAYMSMGDFTNPGGTQAAPTPFNFSATNLSTPAGGGGAIASSFLLLDQSNFSVQAVPEPSSWLLLASGGAGLAWFTRKKRRAIAGV